VFAVRLNSRPLPLDATAAAGTPLQTGFHLLSQNNCGLHQQQPDTRVSRIQVSRAVILHDKNKNTSANSFLSTLLAHFMIPKTCTFNIIPATCFRVGVKDGAHFLERIARRLIFFPEEVCDFCVGDFPLPGLPALLSNRVEPEPVSRKI